MSVGDDPAGAIGPTVVLYAGPASYMSWCLDELRSSTSVEVAYLARPPLPDHAQRPGARVVGSADPIRVPSGTDVVLVSGWFHRRYLTAAWRARRTGSTIIILFDTQPRPGLRWKVQASLLGLVLRRIFHGAFVAGDRQRQVARDLGFRPEMVEVGMYACPAPPDPPSDVRTKTFLWVGRLVPAKALEVQLEAYRRYRAGAGANPWSLLVVGDGDQRDLLDGAGLEGVEHLGHLPPARVIELMRTSGALVSSSRVEPWGMVIAEAAAAALPVICTTRAGAGDHLVEQGVSGLVVPPDDADALAGAMTRLAELSSEDRAEMGRAGWHRSTTFTPERWVERLGGLVARCRR